MSRVVQIAGLCAIGGAVIALGFADLNLGPSILLPVTVGLVLCALPFVLRRFEPSPLAPIYLTLVYMALAYPIKLLAVRAGMPYVSEDYIGLLSDDGLVTEVLWLFVVGLIAFFLGYYRPPRVFMRPLARWHIRRRGVLDSGWPWRALAVGAVGWASLAAQMALGVWSSFAGVAENWDPRFNSFFSYTANYFWLGLIAATLWLWGRQPKQPLGVLICGLNIAITLTLTVFFFAAKMWILFAVIWFLMLAYMAGRRPAGIVAGSAVLAALFFAFSYVPTYRSAYIDRYGGGTQELGLFVKTGYETMKTLGDSPADPLEVAGRIVTRFGGVDSAALVIHLVPDQFGYWYFRELLTLPFSVIPRAILPQKPDFNPTPIFNVDMTGGTSGGATAPHPVAEGYFNLGWVGVPIVFWIWGVYQALWFRGVYLPRPGAPLVCVIAAYYLIKSVLMGDQWIIGSLLGIPGQLLALIPLVIVLGWVPGGSRRGDVSIP